MIPFGIRKMTDKNGSTTLHIALDSKYLVEDGMLEKIVEIEKLTNALVKDLKQLLKKIGRTKNNNVELHWEVGDKLYRYLQETKERGFECSSLTKMLEDYMPKYRTEHWRIRLKFREEYPNKDFNNSVPFEMYHELLFVEKKNRKRLEDMMRDGKIKKVSDMRAMRITTNTRKEKHAN